MVRICTTVVGILAALATASLGKPVGIQTSVADVQQDMEYIRLDSLPKLTSAVQNLGSSPDEVTGSQVQALNSGAVGLLNALNKLDSDIKGVPSVSSDEAARVLGTLEEAHPKIVSPIDELKGKSTAFTGNKTGLKTPIHVQMGKLKTVYVKMADDFLEKSPEGPWKDSGMALRSDAIQHFDECLKAFA
ncbi:hypothetical protein AAF712_008355 [Marasmius tenuissimus]|uniref:Hydrophobic surface binding protein A-domain-containing protein n=1 Tax=Marasmius tenuissimus TaxID=585030 RepID=A0ABR2ZUE6_9AGAR